MSRSVSDDANLTMRHVWSGTAVADPTELERVIEAARWILRHTGWHSYINPAYLAYVVLWLVALVAGVNLVGALAIGVAVTLATPLVSSRLARRAERALKANGEGPRQDTR